MIKYFSYGSNISENRMLIERKVNFVSRKFALLYNYKLVFNKVSKKNCYLGFANIVESVGDIVEGALYELNDSDISIIDKFEGANTTPQHYYRKNVEVICAEVRPAVSPCLKIVRLFTSDDSCIFIDADEERSKHEPFVNTLAFDPGKLFDVPKSEHFAFSVILESTLHLIEEGIKTIPPNDPSEFIAA